MKPRTPWILARLLPASIAVMAAGLPAPHVAVQSRDAGATAERAAPFALGDVIEDFRVLDLRGKPHTLDELRGVAGQAPPAAEAATEATPPEGSHRRGKITVIDFWSNHCPVSRGYDERFRALVRDYRERDVAFVMLDANVTDPPDGIAAYLEEHTLPFEVYVDEGNRIADAFGGETTPHVFVLDRDGVLRYRGGVDDDPRGRKAPAERASWLRQALDALLAGEDPPRSQTQNIGCSIKRVRRAQDAG